MRRCQRSETSLSEGKNVPTLQISAVVHKQIDKKAGGGRENQEDTHRFEGENHGVR